MLLHIFRLEAKALKRSVVKSLGPDEQVSKGQDREPKKQGRPFLLSSLDEPEEMHSA